MRRYLLPYLSEPLNPTYWLWMKVSSVSADERLEYKLRFIVNIPISQSLILQLY